MRIGFQVLVPVLFSLLTLSAAGQAANEFFDRGLDRQKKGDFAGAIADYTWAIDLNPKNARAYNNRGEAKRHQGDMDGAITDFTRALELDPKHAQVYNNRGFARKQQGDLDGAIADYTRALKIDPKNATACNNRGIAHYLNHSWTETLADFRRKADLSPPEADFPPLYLWILRTRLGDSATADRELAGYMLSRAGMIDDGRWAKTVGAFLRNHLDEEALLRAAASADREKERGQQCSAWFFSGMKLLLAGERTAAAEHFRKCLATERKNDPEYEFAMAELKVWQ